ncbi:MAG: triose-phosphate isomerase [Candidatus Bathyarchaeota archaeon]|nr:MAG: triose-phosphate isomerase [Candidatus Bathyarchaeota archaeon]
MNLNTLWTPLILVNFKAYTQAMGKKALELANMAESVSAETDVCIGLAPQYTDIQQLAQKSSLPIFAQHVDPIWPGSFTGHILPQAVKEAGVVGTLINHSERRLKLAEIDATVKMTRDMQLASVVCTNNAKVSASAAALRPDFIAIEPPELIGTGTPVSQAKPEIIIKTETLVKQINPEVIILCGAGITKGDDVTAALRLGTKGVLVASGIVKAKEPKKVLLDFAQAATTV